MRVPVCVCVWHEHVHLESSLRTDQVLGFINTSIIISSSNSSSSSSNNSSSSILYYILIAFI